MSGRLEVNLYGPPGSGKTERLIRLFAQLAQKVGPHRVAGVTYTKAAAEELRLRVAPALGLPQDLRTLREALPWVGTIHSLKYRLLGLHTKNVATAEDFLHPGRTRKRFMDWEGMTEESWRNMSQMEADEAALWLYGTARHKRIDIKTFMTSGQVPEFRMRYLSPERIAYLVKGYEEWKKDKHKIDFEDMLEMQAPQLPVMAMVADEVQDNSPLLWSVLDGWGRNVPLRIHAGDPYQAIYGFSGAEPSLFTGRQGNGERWKTIGDSHRFSEESAQYARRVVMQVYGDEATRLLESWRGVGGEGRDGSILRLARTHALLNSERNLLMDTGAPFREYGRIAPLQTRAAEAWKALYLLRSGQLVDGAVVKAIAERSGTVSKITRKAAASIPDDVQMGAAEVERRLQEPLKALQDGLDYAPYFQAVLIHGGAKALFQRPKLAISTIHSAKGREADHVQLVRSWGTLPAQQAMGDVIGRRQEACVAYVAASRHRVSLQFLETDQGSPYPFP